VLSQIILDLSRNNFLDKMRMVDIVFFGAYCTQLLMLWKSSQLTVIIIQFYTSRLVIFDYHYFRQSHRRRIIHCSSLLLLSCFIVNTLHLPISLLLLLLAFYIRNTNWFCETMRGLSAIKLLLSCKLIIESDLTNLTSLNELILC